MKKSFVILALSSFLFLASCNSPHKKVNKFIVKFLNADGETLQTKELDEGTLPIYEGETPTLDAPIHYEYVYTGWDKPIVKVSEDTTYTATYDYVFLFGTYPQTLVSDPELINHIKNDGKSSRHNYIKYNDVEYASYPSEQNYIADDGTRVKEGDTNYYEVKDIQWKILDEDELFYISYKLLEETPYHYIPSSNEGYLNTWVNSALRGWLTGDFFDKAFDKDPGEIMGEPEIPNDAASTLDGKNKYTDNVTTKDKVFILSRQELRDTKYGFTDDDLDSPSRSAKTTDYARATGSVLSKDNYGMYWLRSPADNEFCFDDTNVYTTMVGGHIIQHNVDDDGYCARPAIKLLRSPAI